MSNIQGFGDHQIDTESDTSGMPEKPPKYEYSGLMQGHLQYLIGRCLAIELLHLHTVGQSHSCQDGWDLEMENARYGEFSALLQSVWPTLRGFVFEQGISVPTDLGRRRSSNYQASYRAFNRGFIFRPMDAKFVSGCLSSLVEGSCPKLQRMDIRGVTDSLRASSREVQEIYNSYDNVRERVMSAIGRTTSLGYYNDASWTFWLCDRLHTSLTGLNDLKIKFK